uniref:Uncharacterized protein n=1 Tax=Brassica oleracea TaxID=3712 RepID=A0A3P6DP80_BRAOL|nr:unnamed protein product [Brassica oleracea]
MCVDVTKSTNRKLPSSCATLQSAKFYALQKINRQVLLFLQIILLLSQFSLSLSLRLSHYLLPLPLPLLALVCTMFSRASVRKTSVLLSSATF